MEEGEGKQKPATTATSPAPESLPQQSPAPQEHAPTRSPPVQVLEDTISGRRIESSPRVPASDVRLQGAPDTAPIEEGEGSQKPLPTETSPARAPGSATLALAQSSSALQEPAATRSEDAIGGRRIESAPRVPATDVPLKGAADTAVEEGEGSHKPLPTETSSAPGSTTLALAQSSPAPQEQATTRSDDAIGGRKIDSAPPDPASDVPLQGPGFIFQGPRVFVPGGDDIVFTHVDRPTQPQQGPSVYTSITQLGEQLAAIASAPQEHATAGLAVGDAQDQPARASVVFVPGADDNVFAHVPSRTQALRDTSAATSITQLGEQLARIASSASHTKTTPASDSTTLALAQSSPARREHATTRSPPVNVPADAIGGSRSESAVLPGPSIGIDALFGPRPSSLLPNRDVGVIGGGRPAREAADAPEMGLVPLHAGMPPLRQHVGPGPPGAQLQLEPARLLQLHQHHHAHSPLRLEMLWEPARQHGRHHLALIPTRHNNSENFLHVPHAPHVGVSPSLQLEPALTRMMGTGLETGPLAAMLQRERARLLQLHQQYHARSPLRQEMTLLEPARQHGRHHLALAPTRHDNSESFLQIPREDVQRGWAELQARRRECEELRRLNHQLSRELGLQALRAQKLQNDCSLLRHVLRLHQTPPSSSGGCVAGEHYPGVCGDCSGPAEVLLTPCLHYALCIECYEKRHECPCCRRGFD